MNTLSVKRQWWRWQILTKRSLAIGGRNDLHRNFDVRACGVITHLHVLSLAQKLLRQLLR